ncbi:hypothetical protein HID58_067674 [Brassica napus]|uniref:Polyamine transporter At3g19553 n=1 Tax=Brassica napus TaxID=3708 RepID=A0ABQ7ZJ70_BRANA|nr:hypothetical protein HID58_067674 [Brassica napus]
MASKNDSTRFFKSNNHLDLSRQSIGGICLMGEEATANDENVAKTKPSPKLTLLPLVFLIFYEVSGGPFGVEDSVKSGGGPLLALLGFLILPLIWSIPEALITAELATSFPENGGYVVWISSAFGPFWGFQEGFWKWFSGVMDNALYPVLFLDYLKHSFPVLDHVAARVPALLGITFSLTYLNYRGLHIVGFSAVLLAVFSLCPFLVMALLAVPRIRPQRWLFVDFKKVNWRGYFNTMFWNLNYWDKASTLAGEVESPGETFPKALFGAVLLVMGSYLIPLTAGTGALSESSSGEWSDGYFAEVGMLIGGVWLKGWIQAAAAMSNLGLFEAEMSSDAFQLLGMSEIGMLPAFFAQRLVRMLLEFAAFVKLRIKKPDLNRPYRIPLNTFGTLLLCLPPSLLVILVMVLAAPKTFLISGVIIVVGFCLYPFLELVKEKRWARFIPEDPRRQVLGVQTESQLDEEHGDESSASLLP